MRSSVTIIRHSETEWNVAMRLQGKGDSELTEKGLKQADLAAKVLINQKFDVLISSDQKRAYRTAEIINRYQGLPIIQDPRMRERNFGVMEGLTREEILKKLPEVHAGYMKRKENYPIPDGESLVRFFQRVKTGLQQITDSYAGKKILIVTHGGVLDCVIRMIFDLPLGTGRNFSIYNASINTFSVNDGRWFLEEWGNVDHLKELNSLGEMNP